MFRANSLEDKLERQTAAQTNKNIADLRMKLVEVQQQRCDDAFMANPGFHDHPLRREYVKLRMEEAVIRARINVAKLRSIERGKATIDLC